MCSQKSQSVCAHRELSVSISVGAWCRLPIAGCRLPGGLLCHSFICMWRSHNSRIIISRSQGRRKPRLTSTLFGVLRAVWLNWQRRGRAFAWLLELFFYAWVPHDTIVWKDSLWLWLWLLTPPFVADLHLLCVFDFDFWTGQPTFTRTWFRFQCLKRGRVGRELTMWSRCPSLCLLLCWSPKQIFSFQRTVCQLMLPSADEEQKK